MAENQNATAENLSVQELLESLELGRAAALQRPSETAAEAGSETQVGEDLLAHANLHYGSQAEGDYFYADAQEGAPDSQVLSLGDGILVLAGPRDAFQVADHANDGFSITHLPSAETISVAGIDYVQFNDLTVHNEFLVRSNPADSDGSSSNSGLSPIEAAGAVAAEDSLAAEAIQPDTAENDDVVTEDADSDNAAPDAVDQAFALNEDGSIIITEAQLLVGAGDADGDALSVTSVSLDGAANGNLVDNGDGTWTLTPDANFNGDLGLSFTVSDGQGGSDEAQATITVEAVNDNPDAVDQAFVVAEDGAITFTQADLLNGATDLDGDSLTVTDLQLDGAANGTLADNGDGTWSYTPDPGETGQVAFTFTVDDGQGGSDTAAVSLNVVENNNEPDGIVATQTGSGFDDHIVGTNPVDDIIDGEGGNDHLQGLNGDDTLIGGSGADLLQGGSGSDTLYGGTGDDDLQGENNDDTLYGGDGDDDLKGGAGDDTLVGDFGDDTLKGGAGNDVLQGGAGDDVLQGGGGNDTFIFDMALGLGNDSVAGDGGTDTLDLTNAGDWTITFDDGSEVSSDDDPTATVFSDDSGTIDFGNGDSTTFESVESFSW